MNYSIYGSIALLVLSPIIKRYIDYLFTILLNISNEPTSDQWREIGKCLLLDRKKIPLSNKFKNDRFISLKSSSYLSNFNEKVIRIWEIKNNDISQIPHIKKAFDYGKNINRFCATLKYNDENKTINKVKSIVFIKNFSLLSALFIFSVIIVILMIFDDTSKMNIFLKSLNLFNLISYSFLSFVLFLTIFIYYLKQKEARKSAEEIRKWLKIDS